MDFGGRYGSFLAAVGSAVLALTYGTSVMISNNVLLKKRPKQRIRSRSPRPKQRVTPLMII
jgi:hypothetical protein